jgi:hypothetical protein
MIPRSVRSVMSLGVSPSFMSLSSPSAFLSTRRDRKAGSESASARKSFAMPVASALRLFFGLQLRPDRPLHELLGDDLNRFGRERQPCFLAHLGQRQLDGEIAGDVAGRERALGSLLLQLGEGWSEHRLVYVVPIVDERGLQLHDRGRAHGTLRRSGTTSLATGGDVQKALHASISLRRFSNALPRR